MSLVLYRTEESEAVGRLQQLIETSARGERVEICSDLEALIGRLRRPRQGLRIAVLFCADREELSEIVSVAQLLSDLRVILIVPEMIDETICMGHKLFPRYLCTIDESLEEIGIVLRGMLRRLYAGT